MPYKFKGKRDCTQSDGSKGKYQTIKKDGSKRCYKSEKQYKSSMAWGHGETDENDDDVLEELSRRFLMPHKETKEDRKLEALLRKIKRLNEAPEAQEIKDKISPVNSSADVGQDWTMEADGSDEINEEDSGSTPKYDEDKNLTPKQGKNLPDKVQKAIIDKAKKEKETDLDESDTPHLASYHAPQGSKRDKQLDQTKEDLKKAKELRKKGKAAKAKELEQRAYNRRDRMEKQHREKNEAVLREAIRNLIREELSKSTEDKIRKKAEERGYTYGSMKAEYKKGLAAFASSGSRPGMTAHGWAMARINKCTESQDWSGCKKSKAKKKK